MAKQYGQQRQYTDFTEKGSSKQAQCPICNVKAVPRGVPSTRRTDNSGVMQAHCPNCGHTYGWDSSVIGKVTEVLLAGAGGATEINTDKGTLQINATVVGEHHVDKSLQWESSNAAVATVSGTGLVTAVGNGTVTITATSVSNPSVSGSIELTVSDQA